MRKEHVLWLLPLLTAVLLIGFIGCEDPAVTPKGSKVAFTAGDNVTVAGERMSGVAIFKGDTHYDLSSKPDNSGINLISDLKVTAADFTVTGGGVISVVYVGYDEIKVTVTFTANPSFTESRNFVVKIAGSSAIIKGEDAVTITQVAKIKIALTPDSDLMIAATTSTATARFRGPDDFNGLTSSDFSLTGGATITGVTVTGDIATGYTADVALTFGVNNDDVVKTYVVGIAPASAMIAGNALTITQSRKATNITLTPATSTVSQDFETTSITGSWSISGTHNQSRVADPVNPANYVGRYSASGTGNRQSTITFTPSGTVSGDKIVIEFDWYPGTYNGGSNNSGPLFIAFTDTGSGGGNKVITFLNEHESTLKFRIGNFSNSGPFFDGAVGIPGTLDKGKWYKFRAVIDFTAKRINRLFVWDKATDTQLFMVNDLDLPANVNYTQAVRSMLLYLNRTDGGNTFYLDNVFVGNGERP